MRVKMQRLRTEVTEGGSDVETKQEGELIVLQ